MALPAVHQQEHSSNKFYPPQVGADATLFRNSLVTQILGESACNRKAIVIEAQAGQGKSTLALQFLQHFTLRFSWYQIGPEDRDPSLLLSSLLENFEQKLPGFTSPRLSRIMDQEEIDSLDIIHCANILLTDLDRYLADDFYIVFDDLHLGEQTPLFNGLLGHVVDSSPPHIHFILISRRPLLLDSRVLRYGRNTITLLNSHLSFTLKEVEELFSDILERPIARIDAERIRKQTSGWIMGILLAAHAADQHTSGPFSAEITANMPADLSNEQIIQYFRDEILAHVPQKLHAVLMQLSLLDTIALDLAKAITGSDDIGVILTDLMRENFFIYPLDEQRMVFRFHHLFQEFLQEQAVHELPQELIHNVYATAAAYYLEKNSIVQALLYYRKEDNYPVMEDLLRRQGLNLLAKNRTVTLLTLLQTIPEEDLLKYPWLTFFTAVVHADSRPQKALPLLESARYHFIHIGNETGELLSLAHLIFFHFVVSGLYNTGAMLLARAEELFVSNQRNLPRQARILVARNLGAGYAFFLFDLDRAGKYARLAQECASRHDIRNSIAACHFVCGYIETLADNHDKCLQEIEMSTALLHDPLVGIANKLTLRVFYLNTLSKNGDSVNFNHQLKLLHAYIDSLLVQETLAAPFGYVWGAIALIQQGKIDQAEQLLQRGLKTSKTARTPHMRSQFLQWLCYIFSIKGQRVAAVQAADEATQLRKIAGGPFYSSLCTIICGATFTHIGEFARAEELLGQGMEDACRLSSAYLQMIGHWQQAWLYLQTDRSALMQENLHAGLSMMKDHKFSTFWSWEPEFMGKLLGRAMAGGQHPHHADQLCRKHLQVFYDQQNSCLPLLEISILGTFSIKAAAKTVVGIENLTPAQRNLTALLLAEKNQQIHQDKIQLALWPDSPPQKTRAKLDTLIKRLRKVLDTALPCPAAHYLKMNKSMLCLDNCRIDGAEFISLSEKGLRLLRMENYWQAGNSLFKALQLWKSVSSPHSDLFTGENSAYYDHLLNMLAKTGLKYGGILAESDCAEEAVEIVLNIIRICPMDDRLITLLYTLYLRLGDMLKAKKLLQQYRKTLRNQGYNQDEIDELLFRIATSTAA